MRRLPPLTAIEAFVQVARLGSVKAAAAELALSSPALSRRVQTLERAVGHSLFDRRHQAMLLNAEGQQLLARLSPPLDALAAALDTSMGDPEMLRLRLNVPPLFASQRMMRALPELRARHPELHIDIDTAPHPLARLGDELDAAIVLAREVDANFYSHRLDRSQIAAIASRGLAEGPDAIRVPADLARTTIFLHRDMADIFADWRSAMGVPELEPAAVDHFDSGHLMLDAAAQGLGVAFMLEEHVDDAQDDRLISLFDRRIDSQHAYWFASRKPALSNRAVRLFRDWLLESVARG